MRDQSIYEINFPNRNIFDCVTRSHSTLFNSSAIGYLHRPSSCNNHRCPFSDTNRANVFVRVFFSVHKTTKETTFKMEKRKETDI